MIPVASFRLAAAVAGFAATVALPASNAPAQTKAAVGGMVTLKLTDPAGGEPWRIQRRLLRTFSSLAECEEQKESFISVHVRRVEGHGLMTASGASPVVAVEAIECFMLRGEDE